MPYAIQIIAATITTATMRTNGRKTLPKRRTSLVRVDIRTRRLYQKPESASVWGSGRASLSGLEVFLLNEETPKEGEL